MPSHFTCLIQDTSQKSYSEHTFMWTLLRKDCGAKSFLSNLSWYVMLVHLCLTWSNRSIIYFFLNMCRIITHTVCSKTYERNEFNLASACNHLPIHSQSISSSSEHLICYLRPVLSSNTLLLLNTTNCFVSHKKIQNSNMVCRDDKWTVLRNKILEEIRVQ